MAEHRVHLELTGAVSVAACSCSWRSRRAWVNNPEAAAEQARRHWRRYADRPGDWPPFPWSKSDGPVGGLVISGGPMVSIVGGGSFFPGPPPEAMALMISMADREAWGLRRAR